MKNIYLKTYTLLSIIILPTLCYAIPQNNNDSNGKVLLSSYFNYNIINEVKNTISSINTPTPAKQQIQRVMNDWAKSQKQNIRINLKKQFAEDAKQTFSFFIKNYTDAENKNDLQYLETLAHQTGITPTPESFTDLRNIVINQWLENDINHAGTLLSEIQTWNELYKKDSSTPQLQSWLDRDKIIAVAPAQKSSLKNREPDLPEFIELDDDDNNAMDIYDNLQSKRREKVLEESQKYMKQIAEERKSAEEEYAQKKSAAANKEAAAVKAHAQKLAAAESEIMEQRKHTWTARVSKLVTSVTGGAFSAVTGGIGSAAGAAAAQAIFE